jgi:hypothetical protein
VSPLAGHRSTHHQFTNTFRTGLVVDAPSRARRRSQTQGLIRVLWLRPTNSERKDEQAIGDKASGAGKMRIGRALDSVVLPHLEAAFRLARWLSYGMNTMQNERSWQEASLRALRYFPDILRLEKRACVVPQHCSQHTCLNWGRAATLQRAQPRPFDEERHSRARLSIRFLKPYCCRPMTVTMIRAGHAQPAGSFTARCLVHSRDGGSVRTGSWPT